MDGQRCIAFAAVIGRGSFEKSVDRAICHVFGQQSAPLDRRMVLKVRRLHVLDNTVIGVLDAGAGIVGPVPYVRR